MAWRSVAAGRPGLGGYLGSCRGHAGRAVEERLAAEPGGDVAGFADGGRGGHDLAPGGEVGGVIEEAVGQVVGSGVLAQAGDRRGERLVGARVALGCGQAGASQVAFGAQHGGQLPGLVAVEQGEQLGHGGGVGQVVRGSGGQGPGPPGELVADPQDAGAVQGGTGVTQRGGGLAAGGGGERLRDRDVRPVLRVFGCPLVTQPGQGGLGGGGVTAQRRTQAR